jgi:hypothetical protein
MFRAARDYLGDRWRLAAVAVLLATVGAMSFVRLIDGDEGFFLMASRLVSQGLRPYHDFFFIHAPMVPYLFGPWFRLVGPGWYTARALVALIGLALGVLMFDHLRRTTGKGRWALLGVVLYAGTGLVLGWFTVAKTLGLSALFMFAGTCALTRRGRLAPLVGGALLGLAASTRLYLLIGLLCAVIHIVRGEGDRRRAVREVALLALGGLLGVLPLLFNLLRDHQAFLFGTVEYHALRDVRHAGVIGDWPQKWATLLSILGIEGAEGPGSTQFFALLAGGVTALVAGKRSDNSLFAYNWMALLVISILPTPSYQQYFCLLVPFLIVEVVVLLATVEGPRLEGPRFGTVLVVGLGAYCLLGVFDAWRYAVTGQEVPGVILRERVPRWRIGTVRQIARAIDQQQQPVGGSWWPGYFVGTRTGLALDLVNDFGRVVAESVSPERRRRFHIRTHAEVTDLIRAHDPPLFVEGNWTFAASAKQLPASGYTVAATVPARIWVYHQPPARSPGP